MSEHDVNEWLAQESRDKRAYRDFKRRLPEGDLQTIALCFVDAPTRPSYFGHSVVNIDYSKSRAKLVVLLEVDMMSGVLVKKESTSCIVERVYSSVELSGDHVPNELGWEWIVPGFTLEQPSLYIEIEKLQESLFNVENGVAYEGFEVMQKERQYTTRVQFNFVNNSHFISTGTPYPLVAGGSTLLLIDPKTSRAIRAKRLTPSTTTDIDAFVSATPDYVTIYDKRNYKLWIVSYDLQQACQCVIPSPIRFGRINFEAARVIPFRGRPYLLLWSKSGVEVFAFQFPVNAITLSILLKLFPLDIARVIMAYATALPLRNFAGFPVTKPNYCGASSTFTREIYKEVLVVHFDS
jgi:hypothetical protein